MQLQVSKVLVKSCALIKCNSLTFGIIIMIHSKLKCITLVDEVFQVTYCFNASFCSLVKVIFTFEVKLWLFKAHHDHQDQHQRDQCPPPREVLHLFHPRAQFEQSLEWQLLGLDWFFPCHNSSL